MICGLIPKEAFLGFSLRVPSNILAYHVFTSMSPTFRKRETETEEKRNVFLKM